MKLLIDSADLKAIKEIYEYCPISGVTTNPTILKRANEEPKKILEQIRQITGKDEMHVQAIGEKCKDFIADAQAIRKTLGEEVYVKIPATREGFKAMKALKAQGFHITATAIYYVSQALLASATGVDYIAPYYNRICKEGMNGKEAILSMMKVLEGTETRILAASFRTAEQTVEVACLGVHAMTLSPDVWHQLTDHPKIDEVTKAFNDDFHELTGTHCTLKDVLGT